MEIGLKIEDLDRLRLVSDPKISYNQRYTVFTVTHPSLEKNSYISSIWLMDNSDWSYNQVVDGDNPRFPEWVPGDKEILYLSTREESDGKVNEIKIFDISRDGGRIIYSTKNPVSNLRVSSDGRTILFIEQTGEKEDVMVIDSIPIWFNGKGFTYNKRNVVNLLDKYSGNYIQLDIGGIDVSYAEFGDRRDIIYFVGTPDREKPYITHLYRHEVDSGETIRLTDESIRVLDFTVCGDDCIVFRGQDFSHGLSTHRKLYRLDTRNGDYSLLTDIDLDIVNAINCDVRGPSSSRPIQFKDNYIYFPLSKGGCVALYRVSLDGDVIEPVIEGDFTVENYSVSRDYILITRHDPTNPPELYVYRYGEFSRLTGFNDFIIQRRKLSRPSHFRFRASDGEYIDGWIMKPPNFKEGSRYPSILYIHGGPATTFGYSFMYEFQVLASVGFVIIYTNPRGSTGYSQLFKDIRGHYGERDYMDLMEAVEYVLSEYDFIDRDRLGVTGGSYGGFMTNWIIGHTDIFKAAVTQRSICNWISKFGTTDIGFYFNSDQIAGGLGRPFWEDDYFKVYWDKSPLKYVKKIKTPTLIIHSIEDYRCWVDQAIQLFTALKLMGVDTRLVLFPGENHDLSRTGKPRNRVERIKHIIEWFKKYLS